ncbi:MAG: urea carboxylase-associated family protein [bacterium]|nr:urea carboxylase-associated family protein [bacterium]MDE0288546.1 urea carboxylase-associated family protein [bacterium]MDE0438807.1 urea carboxylase-associated family protein [bacterium]
MSQATEVIVPAREGRGVCVEKGQLLDIVDLEGHQVGDLIAWFRDDPSEYLSPTHTVSCNASILLVTGSQLFSNHRNPVFTILRDDVEKHDIIVPCCDHERFKRDYGLDDHPHCLANLEQARDLLGEDVELRGETAWNVFMHNRVTDDGDVVTDPAAHEAGATITLQVHEDLVVLLSACPQDLTPCNDFNPTSMMMRVRDE